MAECVGWGRHTHECFAYRAHQLQVGGSLVAGGVHRGHRAHGHRRSSCGRCLLVLVRAREEEGVHVVRVVAQQQLESPGGPLYV